MNKKHLREDDIIEYKIEDEVFYIILPEVYSIKTGALILELQDTILNNTNIDSLVVDANKLKGITEFGNEMFILRDRVLEKKKVSFKMINVSSDFEQILLIMPY